MTNLITLAGEGKRFYDCGIEKPKPLIEIGGIPMIIKAVNCLPKADKYVFVCREKHIKKFNLDKKFSFRRGYFGGQVYGMVHDFHYDDDATKYDQIITVMFYLNRTWTIEYSGETIFLSKLTIKLIIAWSVPTW